MESNLTNSIYLADRQREPLGKEMLEQEPLGQTEEIMLEDSSAKINQSASKRPIKYHLYEKIMISTTTQQQRLPSQTEEKILRHKAPRLCRNSDKVLLNEYRLPPKPKVDPNTIRQRQSLCRHYQERKAGKVETFKINLLRRIHFQASEEAESSIREEVAQSMEAKESRVHNFLQRQRFFAQEKEILRGMREFCQYGSIRIS